MLGGGRVQEQAVQVEPHLLFDDTGVHAQRVGLDDQGRPALAQ